MTTASQRTARQRLFIKDLGKVATTSEANTSGEFRPVVAKAKVLEGPSGSAYVELGDTKVICSVIGPKEQSSETNHDEGIINVKVLGTEDLLPQLIESAINAFTRLEKLARSELDVEVTVLSDDGGLLAVSVMAAMIALTSASIETYDVCLAAHVLVEADGTFILDPTKEQMKKNTTSVTVAVMPSLGQVVCCNVVGFTSKNNLTNAVRFAAEKCLDFQSYIEKVLLEPLTGKPAGDI